MAKSDNIELTLQPPRLLDRKRMAKAICISETLLDDLRKRGCPVIRVPGTKKILFNPDRVIDWLESECPQAESPSMAKAKEKADAAFGS